jgi:hypothetical protein
MGVGTNTILGIEWRPAMMVELVCPCCPFRFSAPSKASAAEIVQRMIEEGPWFALGNGETFQEMLYTALTTRGAIRCPDCQEDVLVLEESGCEAVEELLTCQI